MDEAGVGRAQDVVSQAQRASAAGRQRVQEDVGAGEQPLQELPALFAVDVQGDGALAGVVVPEEEAAVRVGLVAGEGTDGAAGRARGRLDLDDVSAHVGEELAAPLAFGAAELDDAVAAEGLVAVHHSTCSSSSRRTSASGRPRSSPKT